MPHCDSVEETVHPFYAQAQVRSMKTSGGAILRNNRPP